MPMTDEAVALLAGLLSTQAPLDTHHPEECLDLARFVIEVARPDRPNLGMATTRDLLDEIRARIEIDYFAGGGGLDYSTVKGRR